MKINRVPLRGITADPVVIPATGTNVLMAGPYNVEYTDTWAIQMAYDGTSTGTFKVQVSCHYFDRNVYNQPVANPIWTDVDGADVAIAAAAGNHVWNTFPGAYEAVRIVYTATSVAGIASFYFIAKGPT